MPEPFPWKIKGKKHCDALLKRIAEQSKGPAAEYDRPMNQKETEPND